MSTRDHNEELSHHEGQEDIAAVVGSAGQGYEEESTEADESDDGSEVAQNVVCEACVSGIDEEQLLICDGCDKARHIYCALPQLAAVPEGDWHCEVCLLQAQVKQSVGEHVGESSIVREELSRVSHANRALWRFKVPLSRTGCQVMLHLREFVEALDRAKLRPLMEQCVDLHRQRVAAERQRLQEERQRQRDRQRETRRNRREVAAVLEGVLRKVVRASQGAAKEQARLAKERALQQAREERHAARREREEARIRAEVQRCLDRLLTKVRILCT